MDIGSISIKGRVRKRDEDSILVMTESVSSEEGRVEKCLLVLADGMGGAQRGEKASRIAVDSFRQAGRKLFTSTEPVFDILLDALDAANHSILKYARENRIREMGTTLTAAFFDGEFLNVINVGDSRTYILSRDTPIAKTVDDSFVMELVLSGVISENTARRHPRKNEIMRVLGFDQSISSPTYRWRMFKDDSILLCCDGMWEPLSEYMMMDAISMSSSAQTSVENMAYLANEIDGTDNISAILCKPSLETDNSRFVSKQTQSLR